MSHPVKVDQRRITPTIGAPVLYQPAKDETAPRLEQAWAAWVTFVHSKRKVNVGGFTASGEPFAACDVQLVQYDDLPRDAGNFAEWPPEAMPTSKPPGEREAIFAVAAGGSRI